MKDLLLITPPFTQLNTPYPATAYIKGFLNTKGISAYQIDLGIEVILQLFSKNGLSEIFEKAATSEALKEPNVQRIYALRADYLQTITNVVAFLQGKNQTFARQICSENYLPQASRFAQLDDMEWAFGTMGVQDKAKHLATLYLEDLSDFIVACIDENFGFSRYAERLGRSANAFDELHKNLQVEPTYIDKITLQILEKKLIEVKPKLVCFSVPFPGNLYSAFRCAKYIKTQYPEIKIAMGGGFPNTELRSVSDVRVFDYFDFISLDDGELPLELIVKNVLENNATSTDFKRTFVRRNNEVIYLNKTTQKDYKQSQVGTPDYSDLQLENYISVIEIANPMHSLWSDGRWNKLTMAHGCYWGKCTFCDVSLDYIKLYEPIAAQTLVDRMEELIAQTGETGFHFVDEAAPPALMRELALEVLRRKLTVTWWTNIRFEKRFTRDLCVLLKASGCIAVSGGLEVASDRLLALIDKGVTVEQVAQVTRNFTEAGVMVHSYLMYGYPTQTIQETIDSLEMVRQLFELGVLQSGFWHQFALTAHSPVGLNPSEYGIVPDYKSISFANNDIQFRDKTGIDHDKFSFGLKKSLFNFMHSVCFDYELQEWFDFKVPRTTIPPDFIENCLAQADEFMVKPDAKIVWLGNAPQVAETKKKNSIKLVIHDKTDSTEITFEKEKGEWLLEKLQCLAVAESIVSVSTDYSDNKFVDVVSEDTDNGKSISTGNGQKIANRKLLTFNHLKTDFETHFDHFELFWYAKPVNKLREVGLLVL